MKGRKVISESDLVELRRLVKDKFYFEYDPFEFMWTDYDGEPVDEYSLLDIPEVSDVRCGCSKAVLFLSYLDDYVIKLPFLGTEDGIDDDEPAWFKHAIVEDSDSEHDGWDYCRVEEAIYKKACDQGIEKLFCGTRYLCSFGGFPIYVSEKSDAALCEDKWAHCSSRDGLDYIRSKRKSNSSDFLDCLNDMEDSTIGMFYDSWGKETTDKFLDFLVDNNVRDCHNGNVAFKDGKIRVIDYSSFDV